VARNRLIKREFFRDEKVGALTPPARLLFISLWIQADDSGNGRADARLLRAEAFALDDFTIEQIEGFLQEIVSQGMVKLYDADGARFYHVRNFGRHQVINHPSRFRFPALQAAPLEHSEGSGSAPVVDSEDSALNVNVNDQRSTKKKTINANGGGADAPSSKAWLEWWSERYKREHRVPPTISWAKNMTQLKPLLEHNSDSTVKAAAEAYLSDTTSFTTGHPLGIFIAQFDKWRATARETEIADDDDSSNTVEDIRPPDYVPPKRVQ